MDKNPGDDSASPERLEKQLDPHEAPPQELKDKFKSWSGRGFEPRFSGILDLTSVSLPGLNNILPERYHGILRRFMMESSSPRALRQKVSFPPVFGSSDFDASHFKLAIPQSFNPEKAFVFFPDDLSASVYSCHKIPGLFILPSLLPPTVQKELLSRLLHRDLSNPDHQTNLHLHYDIDYPEDGQSFFSYESPQVVFRPKNPEVHKPLDMGRVLTKKLRWITLGGQYNWTDKAYPSEKPPEFPRDIAQLIGGLFPEMEPQAAIVNVYSPGDTLSLHRDVSEEVNRGLVSISLGCDALFVIGLHDEASRGIRHVVVRLRSGDALYMTGESRFAWHGVPNILPGTCPEHLADWPGNDYSQWRGWMQNKRINLNVRQMRESKG